MESHVPNGEKTEAHVDTPIPSTNASMPLNIPLVKTGSRPENTLSRIQSHMTTHSLAEPGPPPDGGFRAWSQVFCAWMAIVHSWGFVNSFGAFQPYYETILPEPVSVISWIGSVQACLVFGLGIFSGRALDRGWFRPTVALGIVVQLVGIFTMSVARNYWQLLLTQGFCTGIGGGIFFVPIMGVCATYFAKKKAMALGMVTSGTAMGGILYPLVVRQLLGKVGFGWTVRVLGFMNVVSLAFCIAFMRPRLPPRRTGPLLDWAALRDAPYCLQVLGTCFMMPPVYCVFYYVASFARDELDMPYTESLNLVIIINGVGLPARVLPGFIADRYIGVLNMQALALVFNVVMLWTWLSVRSVTSYYVWVVFYGLGAGAFQSLFPSVIGAYSPDITKTGTRLGMAFTVIGFSALVGGPISGALLQAADGDYRVPISWAAMSMMVGTALCSIA
ncbi:hypothetical protein OPT61_g10022 [Boeremia exigua]|uniref:Uncharacterized protein n=1 Tax=Boeremia exigua TaxID=749465 RepID=A0ACC2HRW3_9PLEO|nr:hypothetical protein OPT61_g10022 [Boeremia exigua]